MTTLEELLEPQKTEHWGSVYEFVPAMLTKTWGDGRQIVKLFPIMERPRYWIVRVDSGCLSDDELFIEILDDIYDAIDEEFGCPSEEDLEVGDERPYFPMYDGQGVVWRFVRTNAAL